MRIYDRELTGSAAAESGRTQETPKLDRDSGARPATAAGGSGDLVELSSTLASVSRALSSYQSDRASKVQELSGQFQSGSYQPDSLGTSRGIVAEALSTGTA